MLFIFELVHPTNPNISFHLPSKPYSPGFSPLTVFFKVRFEAVDISNDCDGIIVKQAYINITW